MGNIFYDCDYTHRLGFTKDNLERACLDYGFAYYCVRYLPMVPLKIVNLALVSEIIDNIPFTKTLRKRITKTLFDNVYIQAERLGTA
jgi:hypothetical protein